jgi:hypothetical protein
MDVHEHERLSNFTLRHKLKEQLVVIISIDKKNLNTLF